MKHIVTIPTALVVLLALTAIDAPGAEDWRIYGKLHVSAEMHDNGDDGQLALSSNGSRFGVKGQRQLNECLTAVWQFEQLINVAQKGAETLATRNSFVGVKGRGGTLLAGIHDTPLKIMGSKITFFRDEIGDYRQSTLGWDRRLQDVVMYTSPELAGFKAQVMYQFDQAGAAAAEGRTTFGANLGYQHGGLYAGAAFEAMSAGFAAADWSDTTGTAPVTRQAYGNSARGLRVGAKYVAGRFGIAALYQRLEDYNQSSFAVGEFDPAVAVANDREGVTFGGEGRYLPGESYAVKAAWYRTDPDTDRDEDEYSLVAFGVDYHYAKDLWFYLQYAVMVNGAATSAPLGSKNNGHGKIVVPAGPGLDPAGVSLGVAKTF